MDCFYSRRRGVVVISIYIYIIYLAEPIVGLFLQAKNIWYPDVMNIFLHSDIRPEWSPTLFE